MRRERLVKPQEYLPLNERLVDDQVTNKNITPLKLAQRDSFVDLSTLAFHGA